MVCNLPTQYVFLLVCCYKPTCLHLLCQKGKPLSVPTWYPNGPPVTTLPLPIPDPDRPWGNANCPQCKGFCAGHYKPPVAVDVTDPSIIRTLAKPPSALLKDLFNRLKGKPVTDDFLKSATKQVLLPPC